MPTLQDMGLAATFNQPQGLDMGVLLQAVALRNQKEQAAKDEAYRQRAFRESVRQADRSFGENRRQFDTGVRLDRQKLRQQGRQLDISQQNANQQGGYLKLAQDRSALEAQDRERQISQEAAAQGMYLDLADTIGLFTKTGPDGTQFSIPGAREHFASMSPEDQQQAIKFRGDEIAQERFGKLYGELGGMVQNAAAAGIISPEEGQSILLEAQANPDQMDQVVSGFRKAAVEGLKAKQEQERRAVEVQGFTETAQQLTQVLHIPPQIADGVVAMMAIDPKMSVEDAGQMLFQQAKEHKQATELGMKITQLTGERQALESQIKLMLDAASKIPVADSKARAAAVAQVNALTEDLRNRDQDISRLTGRDMTGAGLIMPGDPGYSEAHAALGLTSQRQTPNGTVATQPSNDEIDAAIEQARKKLGKKAKRAEIEAEAERILREGR